MRGNNISLAGHSIKQHETVKYLGCQTDSKSSGEAMASKVLKKMNANLKFLYRQSRYLTTAYIRLFCNALIQPHLDFRCSSWFLLLKKILKLKLQKARNKCIRFYLDLPPRSHMDPSHLTKTNWLLASDRVEYCIVNIVFKYWNLIVPRYIHEMFKPSLCRCNTRSQMALDTPLRKTSTAQKSSFFLGSKI